jgi:hypothetical protein
MRTCSRCPSHRRWRVFHCSNSAGPEGRKSIAHGVSRGTAFSNKHQPRSGERFLGKSFAAPRLDRLAIHCPPSRAWLRSYGPTGLYLLQRIHQQFEVRGLDMAFAGSAHDVVECRREFHDFKTLLAKVAVTADVSVVKTEHMPELMR